MNPKGLLSLRLDDNLQVGVLGFSNLDIIDSNPHRRSIDDLDLKIELKLTKI
jgi:hypothetical protein